MKLAVCFLVATSISLSLADELADCKCWTGYEPKKNEEGVVKCFGILLFHIMDCNMPQRPKCECSGNVTGIVSDATGTWCSEYSNGKEQRKWECENKDQWEEFYKQYPNEKP